jgi:hypothetical protein
VYLVSDGRDASVNLGGPVVQFMGTSPSGQDALFTTADGLVPQAADTQMGLYDARVQGGFPAPVLAAGCVGETCRGASGLAPSLSSPGSAAQAGGGNLAPPVPKPAVKSRVKPSPRLRKLAAALRACARRPRAQRAGCVKRARKRYTAASRARSVNRGGK